MKKNKKIVGINSHIGSLFLEHILFQEAALLLLKLQKDILVWNTLTLEEGLGIAYKEDENDFPIEKYSKKFTEMLKNWTEKTQKKKPKKK